MERSRWSLSGSKTRFEKVLKKSGVTISAASQPASMIASQMRLSRVSTVLLGFGWMTNDE